MHLWTLLAAIGAVAALSPRLAADDPSRPNPVPLTRPEMKQYLENTKERKPRIPLPELTAKEKDALGERGASYESRLSSLPAAWRGTRQLRTLPRT